MRLTLLPPKPKELLSTRLTVWRRISNNRFMLKLGSAVAVLRLAGNRPSRRHRQQITASVIPAAPSACPVQPLVELHGVLVPNRRETARSSALSLARVAVPCRLM